MFDENGSLSRKAESISLDLTQVYGIKYGKDTIRIRAPDKKTLSVPRECDAALAALSVFAPDGVATVDAHSRLSIVEVGTGRTVEFQARHVRDIGSLLSAFAIAREAGKRAEPTASGPSPLPAVIFSPPSRDLSTVPEWIADNPDLKPTLVEDDGRIVLSFAPLRMSSKSKYLVEGRCESGVPDYWGYEVSADGHPFGWVVLMDPATVLVTGAGTARHSKHRNIRSAMFRLSSHLDGLRSE
ncbi:hypothetical protein GOB57_08515 [Sinorhizobium meliloti]|nr:hypothetical protein [Sinorhizobium meliloti]